MTYDNILADIKKAMIEKDTLTRDCLRSVVSEIKNQTVNAGKQLTEDVCMNVLKKSVKQRNDSIESFKAGGRDDLVKKEQDELEVLEKYLPKMYSEEQVQMIVLKVIADNKIEETKKSFGTIMKALNALPDKNLIDKKVVSQYLGTLLK